MGYWEERLAKALQNATDKTAAETEAQIAKYYQKAQQKIIGQFEQTYNKILLNIEDGKAPTPADLYKLDTYWKMQAQLKEELTALGDKQAAILSSQFEKEWHKVYEVLALKDDLFFSEIDTTAVKQMINNIWCADGKTWSARVWGNVGKLQEALNESLIDCLVTGKNPSELKKKLMQDFGASFNRADTLVRTELAHIQTEAARDRYRKAGVQEVEVLADKDERRCDVCGELHKKRFPINGAMPVPAHPRCRCCILPVIEKNNHTELQNKTESKNHQLTLQNNNDTIQLSPNQLQAQARIEELQNIPILRLNKYNASHTQHAYDITGLSKNTPPKQLYEAYEKISTQFFQSNIDDKNIDGFIGKDAILYKLDRKSGLFGTVFSNNKIGSVYKLDGDIEKRWQKYKQRFLKE